MREIPKKYNPGEVEPRLIEHWEKGKFFAPDETSKKPKYSVVIPPPNITGNLTIGHMLNNTVQDVYIRWKRMSGFNVLWLPGTDHAGIATQTVVEKKLREEKLTKHELGRDKFVQKIWKWKEVYHRNIKKQLTRMGASVDWSRERFTMDDGLSRAVRRVFVELYKKGLIYKGKRIINWDPLAQTALSDEEVIYREKKDKLYYIKYPFTEGNGSVTIATTRPETMLGDSAVAVNPEDKRYSGIIGKKVLLPVADRVIPVIADKYVDTEFGTGALKITPAHDPNDFVIGEKHGLEQVQVIDQAGKMNKNAGKLWGIDRFEARKLIVERLHELGLIEKIDDYVHNIGYSERGGTIVEPYLSDQWFVSMKTLSAPALEAVTAGRVRFHPERWIKVYEHWMSNIKDWCISRQLWWGHQIPVWYNKTSGEVYCDIDPPAEPGKWEQDPDVLDTWFSSWLWPFSTLGWPDETDDLKRFFPTDLLSTAPDIIFFWVARMIMAALEFTGKVPFTDVYFHNIIRDEKGRKLSKSLGNSPDVIHVMDEYGTDALRFTLVYLAPQGTDIFFSKEKCEIGRNFANKIWNAFRFLELKRDQYISEVEKKFEPDVFENWVSSRLNSTIRDYLKALSEYKINEASKAVYEFVWGDFCDWYIEVLKVKLNGDPGQSLSLINHAFDVFEDVLKLLHPVMPFITEELWQSFDDKRRQESISRTEFPALNEDLISAEIENEVIVFQQIVTSIRNLRAELNLSPSVKCDVVINCHDENDRKPVSELAPFMKELSRTGKLEITLPDELKSMPRFKSITSVVGSYQVYIKIEGLIDIEQEKARLDKEIKRVESFLSSLDKKLTNENFLEKASEDVVNNERKKQSDSRIKLQKLRDHYRSLTE